MARRKIKAGSTSVAVPVFVQDTSSTTGGGLGSLVFNTSGLAAKYRREGDATWTTITLATATVGTWATGGFVSDGGPVTGGYELGIPNAVLAAGKTWAEVVLYGAANMLPVLLEFELDAVDYQDATGFGLSRIDAAVSSRMATYAQPTGFLAATFPATVASTTNITAGTITTVTTLTNLPSIPANWLTATGIAADAITAGKIAADAIGASELAADAVTEIAAGVWNAARATYDVSGSMGEEMNLLNTQVTGVVATFDDISGVNSNIGTVAGQVWDQVRASHATAGTFGQGVASVQGSVTGNVTGKVIGSGASPLLATGAIVTLDTSQSLYAPAKAGDAMTLTSGERDSIAAALLDLANGVESGKTLRQTLKLMAAALVGKRSNSGTATEQFDAIGAPGTARVVGNLNSAGDGTPTLTP